MSPGRRSRRFTRGAGRPGVFARGGWTALRLTPYLRGLRAPNPGPLTLQGTNTWVVGDPAAGPVLVVDPGPRDEGHLAEVARACPAGIAAVLLTHRHADHAEAAEVLAGRAGCGVRAADPGLRVGSASLAAGDGLEVPGARVEVLETPGHTDDSRSLLVTGADGVVRLLAGDAVLGSGTTVIASPDGDLAAYLQSLDLLARVVAERAVREILPGHGPVVTDPAERLAWYRRHRLERLDQVRAALATGARTPPEVVAQVYPDLDPGLRKAAEQSVRAQLSYLGAD